VGLGRPYTYGYGTPSDGFVGESDRGLARGFGGVGGERACHHPGVVRARK